MAVAMPDRTALATSITARPATSSATRVGHRSWATSTTASGCPTDHSGTSQRRSHGDKAPALASAVERVEMRQQPNRLGSRQRILLGFMLLHNGVWPSD